MAGIAAYGNMLSLLNSNAPITINHVLESVKIVPNPGNHHAVDSYGTVTRQCVSLAEIQAPTRKRIICLALTSNATSRRGHPTSWSAAIDAISSGYYDDVRRLFIVSAGNVEANIDFLNYFDSNLTLGVKDPGHSWNALTVGAYTELTQLYDRSLIGYTAIAPKRGLSPFSTTSLHWDLRNWPIKPDVVMEGGNVAQGPNASVQITDDLQLVSAYYRPADAQLISFGMTSHATALTARMAAIILSEYPTFWPETVRGLIVHSANWTERMRIQFLPQSQPPSKSDYKRLVRICGYGVPDQDRALYCAKNSLTLIAQEVIQPFKQQGRGTAEMWMHLFRLPWPIQVLRDLHDTPVSMRVTLSYFIEPAAGEVGWVNRYRYASHVLRFTLNRPDESESEFRRRVNQIERARITGPLDTHGPSKHWVLGENARNVGSVHSDIWEGTAIELSSSNLIGVYPAIGWWRERSRLGRVNHESRYALIVSINTPPTELDIYTPVAQLIETATPVVVAV